MRQIIILSVYLSCLFCYSLQAEESVSDSTIIFRKETECVTPVSPDSATLKSFSEKNEFDYYTFYPKSGSFGEWLSKWLNNLFRKDYEESNSGTTENSVLWIITAIVIVALGVLFYLFKPSLFFRSGKKNLSYQVAEETLEGVNFDKLIANAVSIEDYSEAIRWSYLLVIKKLQDKSLVSWEINKTADEYVREFKRSDLKKEFKELSIRFSYFRYGHFQANSSDYEQVNRLVAELLKRVSSGKLQN